MKFIKVVLLVIIFVPLYLGLDVVQINLNVSGLVNPSFYLSSLQRGGVFASVPDAAVELFRQGVSGMPAKDQAAVEAALREAVDPAWTVELVRPAVTDICLYVKGKVPALSAEIPVGETLDRFFQAFAKNAGAAAAADFRRSLGTGLPDVVRLADVSQLAALGTAVRGYNMVATAGTIAGVACAVLALLCFLLASGLPGGLRWVGAALVLSGLTGVVGSLVVTLAAPGFAMNLGLAGGSAGMAQLTNGLVRGLFGGVAGLIRTRGLILVGCGAACYGGAAVAGAVRARKRAASAAVGAGPVGPGPAGAGGLPPVPQG